MTIPVGMSDEEELRRLKVAGHLAEGQGIGEVYVDYGDDLKELGLIK